MGLSNVVQNILYKRKCYLMCFHINGFTAVVQMLGVGFSTVGAKCPVRCHGTIAEESVQQDEVLTKMHTKSAFVRWLYTTKVILSAVVPQHSMTGQSVGNT